MIMACPANVMDFRPWLWLHRPWSCIADVAKRWNRLSARSMTARISLIPGKTRGHRPRLQI